LKLETSNLKIIIDEKTIKYPDIEVFKGDKILIHGNSGVGKSIMIKSILGIIPNTESNIIINDNTYSKWLINGVGYVDQRIVMFSESVLFNITFSNQLSDVDLKKLKDILILCHLTEKFPDIELLNYKFNSKQFSGGELQRISIARALYFQKGILVFDEATSGLSLQVSKSIISEIINAHSEITFFCITHQEELFSFFEKKIQL